MKAFFLSMVVFLLSLSVERGAGAAVVGEATLSLGAQQKPMAWKAWLGTEQALITPEAIHLATQACVRDAQKTQDAAAYPLLVQLNEELSVSLRDSTEKYGVGILALTELVREIHALAFKRFPEAAVYEPECRKVVDKHLTACRDKLDPIYGGRLRPKIPEAMAKRGLKLAPMTWESLATEACRLQGYYSTANDPNLWKFYTASILYQSVLPEEAEDAEFISAVLLGTQGTRTFDLLNRLARYSAVAGKPNGPTLAFRSLWRTGGPRSTGPATGSRAHSLLPTYTTPWREGLQNLIMTRPYDVQTPFQLLNLEEILNAGAGEQRPGSSPAELGIQTILLSRKIPSTNPALEDYRRTAALAWLAMNAETNVRQNEKLAGAVAAAAQRTIPTQNVWGDPEGYAAIQKEIAAILATFQAVTEGELKLPRCIKGISDFLAEAALVPKDQIGTTSEASRIGLLMVQIEPIAVSLGLEVEDREAGKLYLNLATGQGRAFPLAIAQKNYLVWTPSAYVLHQAEELTTASWREPGVK